MSFSEPAPLITCFASMTNYIHLNFSLKRKTYLKANLYHMDGALALTIFEGDLDTGSHVTLMSKK